MTDLVPNASPGDEIPFERRLNLWSQYNHGGAPLEIIRQYVGQQRKPNSRCG